MSQDRTLTKKRLNELWGNDNVPVLDLVERKYAIISDTHLGDGGNADDFRENENALAAALESYRARNYTLILLGDIEEFWQFDLGPIENRYREKIYAKIRAFDRERVFRIFGNHDSEWGCPSDPAAVIPARTNCAAEALKMRSGAGGFPRILLVHGHQGSTDADKNSWFSRFVVRGLFKPIEPFAKWTGLYGHSSATKSQVVKEYEQIYYGWAKENRVIVICGHSHRAIFASQSRTEQLADEIAGLQAEIQANRNSKDLIKSLIKKIDAKRREWQEEKDKGRDIDPAEPDGKPPKPCYFNSGCALYTDGLTALEIADDEIKLVKWQRDGAQISYASKKLSKCLEEVAG